MYGYVLDQRAVTGSAQSISNTLRFSNAIPRYILTCMIRNTNNISLGTIPGNSVKDHGGTVDFIKMPGDCSVTATSSADGNFRYQVTRDSAATSSQDTYETYEKLYLGN